MNEAGQNCTAYRWLWPLLVALTVCIASGNTIEAPFMPPTLIAKDKVAHFAVFGLIATLLYRALLQHSAHKRCTGGSDAESERGSESNGHNSDGNGNIGDGSGSSSEGISSNLCSLIAIGATALFGISDEIHQSFTPSRMFDLYDFVADALGAVVAVCAYRWLPFYRNALEWPLAVKQRKNNQQK